LRKNVENIFAYYTPFRHWPIAPAAPRTLPTAPDGTGKRAQAPARPTRRPAQKMDNQNRGKARRWPEDGSKMRRPATAVATLSFITDLIGDLQLEEVRKGRRELAAITMYKRKKENSPTLMG